MLHLVFHFIVPLLVAVLFYRSRWKQAFLFLVATMLVDRLHLIGLGLLIHMGLDWVDCW